MSDISFGPDLADIHHRDFGWAASGAAEVLLERLTSADEENTRALVVDLGAGSGILARLVSEAGFEVLGVDISEDMLAVARREAPTTEFVRGSVLDFEIPPCRAVTAIGEVLQYEFDGKRSLDYLHGVIQRVHRALEPGGYFLFDLSGPGRGGPTGVIEQWHDRETYTMFFRATENPVRRSLVRRQVLFVREQDGYRRIDEEHALALFDPEEVERLLDETGFEVERRDGYPGGRDLVGWDVFLAKRRS